MNKIELFSLRPALPGDTSFIMSSFMKALYFGSPWYRAMSREVFNIGYRRVVEGIVSSPNTKITVVCLKESPEVIIGYSVTSLDGSIVHFVYIKKDWRKIGLAKDLVAESIKVVTHITDSGLAIIKSKGIEFNPFKI